AGELFFRAFAGDFESLSVASQLRQPRKSAIPHARLDLDERVAALGNAHLYREAALDLFEFEGSHVIAVAELEGTVVVAGTNGQERRPARSQHQAVCVRLPIRAEPVLQLGRNRAADETDTQAVFGKCGPLLERHALLIDFTPQ